MRRLTAAAVLAVGLLLFQTTLAATVLPAFEHFKVSPQIARAIRAAAGPEVPVATRDYSEPSLNFYLGGPPIRSLSSDDEVAEWAQLPGPGVLVIPRPALERIERDLGPLDLRLIASAQGYNYSRGRWVDLMALEKQTKFRADRACGSRAQAVFVPPVRIWRAKVTIGATGKSSQSRIRR